MANTKSAIKRIRKISKQTSVNKIRKSRFKNALKKMQLIISKKDKKKSFRISTKVKFRANESLKNRNNKKKERFKKYFKNNKKNKQFITT